MSGPIDDHESLANPVAVQAAHIAARERCLGLDRAGSSTPPPAARAALPEGVTAPVPYGPRLTALVVSRRLARRVPGRRRLQTRVDRIAEPASAPAQKFPVQEPEQLRCIWHCGPEEYLRRFQPPDIHPAGCSLRNRIIQIRPRRHTRRDAMPGAEFAAGEPDHPNLFPVQSPCRRRKASMSLPSRALLPPRLPFH